MHCIVMHIALHLDREKRREAKDSVFLKLWEEILDVCVLVFLWKHSSQGGQGRDQVPRASWAEVYTVQCGCAVDQSGKTLKLKN